MPDRRQIQPVDGRRVRDPDHGFVVLAPGLAVTVTWSPSWQRMLDRGDIVEISKEVEE